ncbi:MAG: hypothetical protein Q7U92_10810 [Bradyrhizobium sp.]|uniref:hypothetical protein n=1 Tax=Bradyrhizobium sp. TaxID=376 RepID=UPI0027254F5A|nr:hypothetical protein [Bradyrhizobium sp.]MDO9059492.1 hypothetical protein [Bradyrhizobium sp.]MDP3693112.1 hypothetical protein [Bradyrhizobium sp.]
MPRWMMPFLVAMLAIPSTVEAAGPAGKAAARRAASQLPPGLPRANYRFRTTVATPYPTAQSLYDGPDVMFTRSSGYVRNIPPAVRVVRLPVVTPYRLPRYAVPEVAAWNGWVYGYSCGLNSYGNPWC